MNKDKNNPDNLENTNSVPEHPEVVAVQSKGSSKNKLALILVVLLVLAGIATVILFVRPGLLIKKDTDIKTNTRQDTALNQYYYYSFSGSPEKAGDKVQQKLVLVDTKTGKTTEQTVTTDYPYFISGYGINVPVQFEAEGKDFVVATSDFDALDATAKPNTFTLSKGTIGTDPQVILSGKDYASIADWVYTSDGRDVYYLEQKWGPDRKSLLSTELHRVDVATKKDALVGTVDRPTDRSHSRLFSVAVENTVRFYSSQADGIYETRFDRATTKLTTVKVSKGDVQFNGFAQNALSPDGTKLVYENLTGKFTILVLDLTTGVSVKLLEAEDSQVVYGNVQWSPKSDQVVVNTSPFGGEGQKQVGFKNQILTVNVADRKTTMLMEDLSPGIDAPDYSKHIVNVQGWSPDGNTIVFANNGSLNFYDLTQKKVTSKLDIFKDYFSFDSGTGYGWDRY